jgi:hypothetical protein
MAINKGIVPATTLVFYVDYRAFLVIKVTLYMFKPPAESKMNFFQNNSVATQTT